MKKYIYLFVLLVSPQANATFSCNVNINSVLVYASGAVNILHSGRGDYTFICNLKQDRLGVSITTCAMWTSMLTNIHNNKSKASFYYGGEGSCSTLPTYSASPAPVYIGTEKTIY